MAHTEGTESDAALWRALEGVVLPLSRAQLVRVARENEAPMAVITRLAGLPDRRFHTLEELRLVVARPGREVPAGAPGQGG